MILPEKGGGGVVVFDLEWNSGLYTPLRLDEILQIGAVKLRTPGGPITDTFNAYIRPQLHKRLSPAAAALPDLALSQSSQLDFPTAFDAFLDWCGEDRVFGTWGNSDLTVLIQNQKHWKLGDRLPKTYVDLQQAFDRALGCGDNLALEWAAEYCGVPDIFDPHNALVDAVYTALVARLLTEEELSNAVREPGPFPKGQKALPRRRDPWQGPFDALEKLLNNRGCRKAVCPKCAAVIRVSRWYLGPAQFYYSPFDCPECHRGYVLRLELTRDKKKKLWANCAVYRRVGEKKTATQAAMEGTPIPCKNARRNGRRRRRRGGGTKTPPQSSNP